MSYSPKHNYRAKDELERGDPNKVVKGAELSDDFEAISRELYRQQDEIDNLPSGGGGTGGPVKWADITEKPQQIEVLGVQNIITGGSF